MKQWLILLCLFLFSCSRSIFIAERPVADAHLVVVKLSDKGAIECLIDQVKLPYIATGKSDIVVRDNRVYVGSYRKLHILKQDANGTLQLASSLNIGGQNVAVALHPEELVLYMINSSGLFVVDVRDASIPRLVERILFSDALSFVWGGGNVWGGELSDQFAGTDVACEDGKMVVVIKDTVPSAIYTAIPTESLSLAFDISKPLAPRFEGKLETLSGTSAVAMGPIDHQMFIIGDRLIEYRNFKQDPKQNMFNASWLRKTRYWGGGGYRVRGDYRVMVPGDVVEAKFIVGPFKHIREQKPAIDALKYQEYREWAARDHEVVYIATENALTFYDTSSKWLFWKLKPSRKYNLSDYFGRVYGMDTRGHEQAYLATGSEGVCIVDLLWPTRGRFVTREYYTDLPGPALDVCFAGDKLYILCGEPNMQDVQYNESILAHKKR